MQNCFFETPYNARSFSERLIQLNTSKIGFYSVGLYPLSLAYNCVMQTNVGNLLLAPRPGRELFGAFSENLLKKMELKILRKIEEMSNHLEENKIVLNSLSYLILNCDLIVLSSNSNHVEKDLSEAIRLRSKLNRNHVVIACLVGSFCHDNVKNESYLLCQKEENLAFFSGFHRHGALLNSLDSFTANFCHPDCLTAIIGANMMNSLSPNIQVSAGVHNLEGQYIKAAKNISSIFAGFCHTYHKNNPGILPTLLTLLFDQCLDQASKVAMFREDSPSSQINQKLSIQELGYSVDCINSYLCNEGNYKKIKDHTFSQLKAMVADVRGSMMLPVFGKPTRNFQAGEVLAENMLRYKRCPLSLEEFISWCEKSNLKIGALEGLKSLKYWPQIRNSYSIEFHDSSMINLLYMSILGSNDLKKAIYLVMTETRELSSYCQESIRPHKSRRFLKAITNPNANNSLDLILEKVLPEDNFSSSCQENISSDQTRSNLDLPHIKAIKMIESYL
tara:strand:+ start:12367 stop:13878 length:1512 start_codon:yes stop_codon:yes gene_type:complete